MTAEVSREPTISMQVLQGFVHVVEQAGVSRAELLRAAGMQPERLAAGETRVPRSEAERVFERALELTGDPALGLHWSEGLSHRTFGPVSPHIAIGNRLVVTNASDSPAAGDSALEMWLG